MPSGGVDPFSMLVALWLPDTFPDSKYTSVCNRCDMEATCDVPGNAQLEEWCTNERGANQNTLV